MKTNHAKTRTGRGFAMTLLLLAGCGSGGYAAGGRGGGSAGGAAERRAAAATTEAPPAGDGTAVAAGDSRSWRWRGAARPEVEAAAPTQPG